MSAPPVAGQSTINGVNSTEALFLLGNGEPHDGAVFSNDVIAHIEDTSIIDPESAIGQWQAEARRNGNISTWNENGVRGYSGGTQASVSRSVHAGGSVTNSVGAGYGSLHKVGGRLYSVEPSTTVVHNSSWEGMVGQGNYGPWSDEVNGSTELVIPPSGTVYARVDFLVTRAEDGSTGGRCPDDYIYRLQEADVGEYKLLVNGEVEDSAGVSTRNLEASGEGDFNPSDKQNHKSIATFEFSDIGEESISEVDMSVKARIDVLIGKRTDHSSATYDDEGNFDGCEDGGVSYSYTSAQHDMTFGERKATVIDVKETTDVEIFQKPNGQSVSVVTSEYPFSGYDAGGELVTPNVDEDDDDGGFRLPFIGGGGNDDDSSDEEVESNIPPDKIDTSWAYFSMYDPRWENKSIYTASLSGGSVSESQELNEDVPIRSFTYPVGTGPRINNEPEDELSAKTVSAVGEPEETQLGTPTLPDAIEAYRSDIYTTERWVQTVHEKSISERDIEVYGLPHSDPVTYTPEEVEETQVYESNLTVRSAGINYSRDIPSKIELTLYDASGSTQEPVNGNEIGGRVWVDDDNGQKGVEVGENGQATIKTNETGVVEVWYEPEYYSDSDKKLAADVAYARSSTLPARGSIARWFIELLLELLPVFLLFYMVNALRDMFRLNKEERKQQRRR